MKRTVIVLCVLLLIAGLGFSAVGIYYMRHSHDVEMVVSRVTVSPQASPETPEAFVQEEMQEFVPPEGENIALEAKLTESGHTDVYFGTKATDGRDTTYWEGDGFPASLTLKFEDKKTFTQIAFCLPPLRVWSERTQTVLIETSEDGERFSSALPEQALAFDPMSGNAVLLTFDPISAIYIRFTFLSNTGAAGGQASEIMIFQ